jgi:hypothetical protein
LDEALYSEDNLETKTKLLQQLVSHSERHEVYNKEQIVSAILRTIEEEHRTSPDLTRIILKFIGYMMDYCESYQVEVLHDLDQRVLTLIPRVL